MDVLKNMGAPLTASTPAAMGNAQRVVLEVLVSKILRKVMRMADRSFLYLAAVHTLSLPLIGGIQAVLTAEQNFNSTNMQQIQAAAGSVPGVYAAEYIVNTSSVGFHVPKPGLRDALITAVAKILTRPLIGNTIAYLPAALVTNFNDAFNVQSAMNDGSNLKRT